MKQTRPVRVIKHEQRQRAESPAQALAGIEVGPAGKPQPSERELKTVVAGWIREHRQRSEEYRQAFADLLKESGFARPRATKLA